MGRYTPHQARYFAEQILLKRPQSGIDGLASAMSGVKVDLNPHQVGAALFALRSPLSNGAILADEVGLGKTIEAGLVLAQCWSERKRHILLIVPAALRTQWRAELNEKFYINSCLIESQSFNKAKKKGIINPFDVKDQVVICSYNFASRKDAEIKMIPWDLVIMDEAHRLRNVYKTNNVTGKRLRTALKGKKKLLLTATPLQNNLMELFGLVSIIDEHVFGDARSFREMFVKVENESTRNFSLKQRLHQFCNRTLRKQVTEYVRYTSRHSILREYAPSANEEKLYNFVSEYLRSDKLYALPQGQRTLITLVLRKLLASSSFAISGTLNSLIERLEALMQGIERELDLNDYDSYDEISDEQSEDDTLITDLQKDREGIKKELEELRKYAELARNIKCNAKGDDLLSALKEGFDRITELGGQRKAVIFTESRRTQEYLFKLLSDNGYQNNIVFLNGSNNDSISSRIYSEWKERHNSDGVISGSKQADMKAAVVEEFRDRASILIGTEAAAEGINLQFCSLIVNYDLPWNPQRIEQRIGRCHRYGQKNDVVVINFLNKKNAADVRVYELLDQKFRLFSGLFGSSDEVLGSIESGMDFEKRIAELYQTCKNADEIQTGFDRLQEEMAKQINDKMTAARQSILENFDDEVAARLKGCQEKTIAKLDKFSQWLYNFFMMQGAERVEPLDQWRFHYRKNGDSPNYNLKWQDAEKQGDVFLRRNDPLCKQWLEEVVGQPLSSAAIKFDNTGSSNQHISFLDEHPRLKGTLSIDKLVYSGYETEEHLIFSVVTEDGTEIDTEMVDRIMELPATVVGDCPAETEALDAQRRAGIAVRQAEIETANKQYYLDECEKLDAYSEDLKEGLQRQIKEIKKLLSEKRKAFRNSKDTCTLEEMLALKDEINKLDEKRKKMQRDIYAEEDRIEVENEWLQDEIRSKLAGTSKTEHIMTISFEIV
ncbi:MAG: helicase domain protein [Bacillus sp. (in: firmicutes)]|nr:helicase domain protein [Bacillus sp. (in: firmicutes)]